MVMMSKTAADMHYFCNFVQNKSRVAGNNRRIIHRRSTHGERQIVKTLHDHEIACLTEKEHGYSLLLDNCGYSTITTSKAMREFVAGTACSGFSVSANTVTSMLTGTMVFRRYVEIPLDDEYKPIAHYTDFKIKGTAVHYKVWNQLPTSRELAGDYALQGDVPDGIKALTKGWAEVPDYEKLSSILRCRKSESRLNRLLALVITGEAVIHAW